jgi:hypothetical protein
VCLILMRACSDGSALCALMEVRVCSDGSIIVCSEEV